MCRIRASFRLAMVFAVILTGIASVTDTEETVTLGPVTGGAVAADLLIARSLGLVATGLGIGTGVVTRPLTRSRAVPSSPQIPSQGGINGNL